MQIVAFVRYGHIFQIFYIWGIIHVFNWIVTFLLSDKCSVLLIVVETSVIWLFYFQPIWSCQRMCLLVSVSRSRWWNEEKMYFLQDSLMLQNICFCDPEILLWSIFIELKVQFFSTLAKMYFIYIYVFMCMFVCAYMYICVDICLYKNIWMEVCVPVWIYVHACLFMCA